MRAAPVQDAGEERLVLANALGSGEELLVPLKVVTAKNGVFGQSDGGKTNTMQLLAELMLGAGAKILALTPVPNWWALKYLSDGSPSPWEVVVFGGPKADFPLQASHGRTLAQVVANEQINAVLDVSMLDERELPVFGNAFARELLRQQMLHPGALHMFLDEAQNVVPQELTLKGEAEMRAAFVKLMKEGRNYGIGWTIGSQETQAVAKQALGQVYTIIAHRLISKRAIKPVLEWAQDAVRSAEVEGWFSSIHTFETGEAIILSPAFLKVAGRYKVRLKGTYDAGKTPEVGASIRTLAARPPPRAEALRKLLGKALQEAADADPEALLARVRGLEAELREAQKPAGKAPPSPVDEGLRRRVRELEAEVGKWTDLGRRLPAMLDKAAHLLEPVRAQLDGAAQAVLKAAEAPPAKAPSPPAPAQAPAPVPRARRPAAAWEGGADGVKPGARAILGALLSAGRPLSREDVLVRAVLSPRSGSTTDRLAELRAAGFVQDLPDGRIALQDGAEAHAGEVPALGAELMAAWQRKVGQPAFGRLLAALAGAPDGLTRSELCAAGEVSEVSGSTTDRLADLRGLGLAHDAGGRIHAHPALRGVGP